MISAFDGLHTRRSFGLTLSKLVEGSSFPWSTQVLRFLGRPRLSIARSHLRSIPPTFGPVHVGKNPAQNRW